MAPRHGWQGRNEIAIRIATLIRLVSGRRRMPPIEQLAQDCGVTPRTIYRDLQALEYARFPLPRRDA